MDTAPPPSIYPWFYIMLISSDPDILGVPPKCEDATARRIGAPPGISSGGRWENSEPFPSQEGCGGGAGEKITRSFHSNLHYLILGNFSVHEGQYFIDTREGILKYCRPLPLTAPL